MLIGRTIVEYQCWTNDTELTAILRNEIQAEIDHEILIRMMQAAGINKVPQKMPTPNPITEEDRNDTDSKIIAKIANCTSYEILSMEPVDVAESDYGELYFLVEYDMDNLATLDDNTTTVQREWLINNI